MPIELRTGLPGAGKTLGAVEYLLELRKTQPERPRYVLGITDLKDGIAIPMTANELMGWKHLPPGSIVFVDEFQKYAPAKRGTMDSPQWIRDLSEHRHLGLDFVFITQHPSLIDTYVRKLVDRHIHTVRKYGTHSVERWRWPICVADPNSISAKKQSEQKSLHRYSKEAMASYKSAELHTVKRTVPRFLIIGAVAFVAIPLLVWAGVHILRSVGGSKPPESTQAATKDGQAGQGQGSGQGQGAGRRTMSAEDWVKAQVPRVPGIPWSAPIFDDQKVQTQPDLMCAEWKDDEEREHCQCYTEQVTKATVPHMICKQYAEGGVYNPYRKPVDQHETARPVQRQDNQANAPQVAQVSYTPNGQGGGSHWPESSAAIHDAYVPPELSKPEPLFGGK